MGNIIKKRRNNRDDYSTPDMPELNLSEIGIIQRSWKIPSSKVTKIIKLIFSKL